MRSIVLMFFIVFMGSLSAQYSIDDFDSNHKDGLFYYWKSKEIKFPEDEFNADLAKKHYAVMVSLEFEGVSLDTKKTTHSVKLEEQDDGKYKLSFSAMYYDVHNNTLDFISEAFFDGVIIPEENEFVASRSKRFSFKDGSVIASIDTRGEYSLTVTFKDPLYGFIDKLVFKKK